MKKLFTAATVALVPLISACADSPTAFSDDAAFMVEGSSSSHTLPTPAIQAVVSGSSVTLTITGSFGDGDHGRHYELFRDGIKIADVSEPGVFVDADLEDGTYAYQAKTKSKSGKGRTTMTYHSLMSVPVEVTVGGSVSYTAGNFGGNCSNGSTNGNLNLTFNILLNGNIVTEYLNVSDANADDETKVSFDEEIFTYTINTNSNKTGITSHIFAIEIDGAPVQQYPCTK